MADVRLLPSGINDERHRALLEVLERLDALDLVPLLVYRIDSVPAEALYALAWQWEVTGVAGWDLATTDEQRRELLRRAIEMHRHKGTPWAITEALRAVGFPSVSLDEGFGRPTYNGAFVHDSSTTHSSGTWWGYFRAIIGEADDRRAITPAVRRLLVRIIDTWKNARSELLQIRFTSYRHDGTYRYDGTMNHSGITA